MFRIITLFLLLALYSSIQGQETRISGTITNEKGQPMEAVTVQLEESERSTISKKDGRYELIVPGKEGTLLFSHTGYLDLKKNFSAGTLLDVQMAPGDNLLNEVIVTAVGIKKNRNFLGYSVGTLNNEDLTQARTTNISNALIGKVAGVRVAGTNGMAGSGAAIFIRGYNTISASNQPLIVVDGIPIDNSGGNNQLTSGVSSANRAIDLAQFDIENLTILKGPAASVLYGSRAAGGAILVTTRQGKPGEKTSIHFNSTTQFVSVNRYPEYQNSYAQGRSVNDNPLTLQPDQYSLFNPLSTASWGPLINGQTVTNFLGEQETLSDKPDNVKDLFRTGINLQNNLYLTGGGENSAYSLGVGNLYEEGVVINNDYVRNNISFSGQTSISDKIRSGINIKFINSRSQRIQQGFQASNPFYTGWYLPRSFSLNDYPYEGENSTQVYFTPQADNPLWTLHKNLWNDRVNRLIGNIHFDWKPVSWANVNYRFGGDFYNQAIDAFDEIGARGSANTNAGGTGGILEQDFSFRSYYSYLNIQFNKQLSSDFELNFLMGNELSWRSTRKHQTIGRKLTVPGYRNLSNASFITGEQYNTDQFLLGLYGEIQLDYKNLATLSITGRNDWSSTFGDKQNSYFYPSFAGMVNLKEAIPFLNQSGFISFLKLFGNYAMVGKEADPYATSTIFVTGGVTDGALGGTINLPFNGLPGYTLSNTIGDPGLGPEFTSNFEIGTELSLWTNRIRLEAAWYNSHSRDIIFGVLSPPSSGMNSFVTNAGELKNKGWEFGLAITPIRNRTFNWTSTFNFTRYHTVVTNLGSGVLVLPLGGSFAAGSSARMQLGEPYGVLYGTTFRRTENGELWLNQLGLPVQDNNFKRIGDPNPDWLLGIQNEFHWNNLDLSFLIDIRKGGDLYSRNIGDIRRTGVARETAEYPRFDPDKTTPNKPYIIDGVGADGQTPNNVPLTAEQYYSSIYAASMGESMIFDATWIRLRELRLSYSLGKLFKQNFLSGIEIGLIGNNLVLITPNFSHFDPENNVFGVSNIQGLEFNGLPTTRSLGFYIDFKL